MSPALPFPAASLKADALMRPDHSYLTEADQPYFVGEYTARQDFVYSATNSLILNFKKYMDRRGRPEWPYKERAFQTAAAFRKVLSLDALQCFTFVPIPLSKIKGDPFYDARLTQMFTAIRLEPPPDVRELIVQTRSIDATHKPGGSATPGRN